MNEQSRWGESKSIVAKILKGENRFCQQVTITKVNGKCPYGHRAGQTYRVTALNSDGLCGSLFKTIHASIVTLHYGGSLLWEKGADTFTGVCPAMGKVHVESKRMEQTRPVRIKTRPDPKDMTGKGFATLDKYRIFVDVLDIATVSYTHLRAHET